MSHSVNIKTQFKNITNLLDQFVLLNWQIKENALRRTYPTDPSKNDLQRYVAVNPMQTGYDVGINIDKEGNAYFVCDFYGGSIESSLGPQMQKIKQGYALAEVKKYLHEEDLDYTVNELATGELVITAE